MAASDPTTGTEELTGLLGWALEVIAALGAVGVGLLTALENLFPPIPSELVLPLAGYLVAQGRLSFVGAVVGSTVGSVLGAVVLYELGRALGEERFRSLLGRVPLVDGDDLDRAVAWFDRHGDGAVFFGRFVPGVRSIVSVPAGAAHLGRLRFLTMTTIGTAVWNALFVGAGWALGRQWRSIGRYSDWLNGVVLVVGAVLLARFVWRRRRRLPGVLGGERRESEPVCR